MSIFNDVFTQDELDAAGGDIDEAITIGRERRAFERGQQEVLTALGREVQALRDFWSTGSNEQPVSTFRLGQCAAFDVVLRAIDTRWPRAVQAQEKAK